MTLATMGVSVLVVWLLDIGLGAIDFEPEWWLSVPSFAGCYSGLHWLFDRYAWRVRLLRKLHLTQLPDLNGEWVGKIESSYNKGDSIYAVSVVINQRWTKMLVRLDAQHSQSRSTTASLRTTDLANPELSYQYVNEPHSNAPATMEMHRGTATLELIGSVLKGGYYTGRGRGEVGTIELRRP